MPRPPSFPGRWSLVLVLAALAGCSSSEPNPASTVALVVRTDKPVYSLAVDQAAVTTLFNLGSTMLYAPMNEYVHVEQWAGDRWINPRPWFFVDGSTPSIPIAPGDSLAALPMDFGYVNNRAGYYRFIFYVALDPRGRHMTPESTRVAEFQVTWE